MATIKNQCLCGCNESRPDSLVLPHADDRECTGRDTQYRKCERVNQLHVKSESREVRRGQREGRPTRAVVSACHKRECAK